jgi:hypothetical protein
MSTLTNVAGRVQGMGKTRDRAGRDGSLAFDAPPHIEQVLFLAETSESPTLILDFVDGGEECLAGQLSTPMEVALEFQDDPGKAGRVISA